MTDACKQFDALIARKGNLTADEAARLEAHVATCAACRDLVRMMRTVDTHVAFAATAAEDPADAPPASAITTERYQIKGEVGRGGLGRVLEALDQVLDRPVALKELFSANAALRRRFVREALITARLQHPSIVPIYDAGHLSDRSPFYAMKLVAGQPLHTSIAQARTLAQRLALLPRVLAVADAMAYAHSKRIIHRDLKPANVLVGAFGETIVIDWGLAKDLAIDDEDAVDAGAYRSLAADHTAAGAVLGTPAFMSPEQAAGTAVDERTDVYALGAILYQLVTGTGPHDGATFEELTRRVITGDIRPVTEREPAVPRDLAAIIAKAMALAPADRYSDAGHLADDLRRFLTGQLVGSHTYNTRELVRRWIKRHRAAVTVALAAALVTAVVATVSVVRIISARRLADEQRATATAMLANVLEEQGRQELLAGHPTRAVAYLSDAYARRPDAGIPLRTLLAQAMRSVESERLAVEGAVAALGPDGTRLVTASASAAQVRDAATGTVIATLRGHEDDIAAVAFSPDGARILTASEDRTARLWDARTGALVATLEHANEVSLARFSPDGTRIVTNAALWDGHTGKLLAPFAQETTTAAFSAEGARLLIANEIWDVKSAAPQRSFEDTALAISPDGEQIVTSNEEHGTRLWTAQTAATLDHDKLLAAAFSPDGTRLATAGLDRTAKLWDTKTGTLLRSLDGHTGAVTKITFNADGTRVVTASEDRTVALWDAQTGERLASFEGHRDEITSVAFSPDGTQILSASHDGTTRLWRPTPVRTRIALPMTAAVGALAPDGTLVVAGSKLFDTQTGKLVASFADASAPTSAAFDRTGTRIVTTSTDHTAHLWDARDGKRLLALPHPHAILSAAFNDDGSRLVTASDTQTLWVWNATHGAVIAKLERTASDFPVRLTKDATRILVASMFGPATIKSVDTGQPLVELATTSPVHAAAFSADGARVVTASIDGSVKIWNARTGALVSPLDGTTRLVFRSWFSADNARLVTVGDNHAAKLWDATTGTLLASYDGHTDDILDASFSPNDGGARLLTLSADHTAKLWDTRTGKLLASFAHPTDTLLGGAFSPDGTRITTVTRDGSLWSWDIHLEARAPAEILRIVSARSPWTLANGILIPDRLRGDR